MAAAAPLQTDEIVAPRAAPPGKAEESPEVTAPKTGAAAVEALAPAGAIERLQTAAANAQKGVVALVRNPTFQTTTISTGTGAVTLGAIGGAFGLASGVVVGGAAGVIPALFTFGLSIPAGAAIGGGTGLVVGTMGGASAGAVGSGTIGYGVYTYRAEIKDGVIFIRTKVACTVKAGRELAVTTATSTRNSVQERVDTVRKTTGPIIETVQKRTSQAVTFANDTAASPKFQVTAASAAGGAVAGGVTGGVVGLAIGVVPALFTFGLSVPIGAAIGTATGGTVGAVGAGAAGFGGYTYRQEIRDTAKAVVTQVESTAGAVSERARDTVKILTSPFKR